MKTLKLTDEKLIWLIEAVEGKPSKHTKGAIIKGELLIQLAQLMESEKPPLKEGKS